MPILEATAVIRAKDETAARSKEELDLAIDQMVVVAEEAGRQAERARIVAILAVACRADLSTAELLRMIFGDEFGAMSAAEVFLAAGLIPSALKAQH